MSIQDIQQQFDAGQLTSKSLVLKYLDRIAIDDRGEGGLSSVIEINPDAIYIAEALDRERGEKGARGPLHGVPILLKDNIDTGDHMHTSAGSVALADAYAQTDAVVARKLREAGAVILGKANLTEWANFMSDRMSNGYSSRGGQTLNPYGPGQFDVGGSSSGSAAAVAANLVTAAIGTETSGSILNPANMNSLVGIKPTVGLVSRTGIIPIAYSQDTAGPLARSVADAAIVLGAIAGVDEQDAATWKSEGQAHHDYTSFLRQDGLKGARIGVARQYTKNLSEDQLALFEKAIEDMKAQGADVLDSVDIPTAHEELGIDVLVYEFKSALNHYLSQLPPHLPVHSLQDVIKYNLAHAEVALKYGQSMLLKSEETSGSLTEQAYLHSRLRDIQASQTEGIDATLKKDALDAILYPSFYGCALAAKAGYPSVTVPAGYTSEGEPFGITFTSSAFEEPTLLKLAYAYEQATLKRVPPTPAINGGKERKKV
ncbi:amidase family protein [Caldalkalibacillus salinus]|uniref:amidase family protein n=1 Tax=Caldalkalibacillus salinus TaxID=2803787 RepID=UPI0019247FAC|nr:amidase family protein [Caldalkalibacillus salinus]